MELKTTEEFIRQVHGAACSTLKTKFEKEFPDLFKRELKVGQWYVYGRSLLNYQGLNHKDLIQAYGFLEDKSWMETSNCGNDFKAWNEASHEEVESTLEKEIIKRFGEDWENAKIEAHADGEPWIGNGLNKGFFDSGIGWNKVFSKHGVLYSNGVFAEPLKEKTIITHEKALKIIAKKLKFSPESIEIK